MKQSIAGYNKLFSILFILWLILWMNFIIRDMSKGRLASDTLSLLSRDGVGKRSYTYGDDLFGLLKFAEGVMPEGADYGIAGLESYSIDWRRAIYYLTPRVMSGHPMYLIVSDVSGGFDPQGYRMFAMLDERRYILKRDNA